MIPTFKDIKTGIIAKDDRHDCSVYWWAEGNGSCDCNRAYAFGQHLVDELEAKHGENTCYGCKRLLCIDVEGDLEEYTKQEVIDMLNEEYTVQARALLDE